MKTVQETLQELDRDELISCYLERQPISVATLKKTTNMTACELLEYVRNKIGKFIDHMRTVPIIKSEGTCILFVYEKVNEYFLEEGYALVHQDEIVELGNKAHTYAYEFSPQGEIAGYYVADNKRTQDDIYGLMTDVLFEASFFGFEQEAMLEEKEKLEESIKEVESGEAKTIEVDDLFEHFGLEREKRSEEEKEIRERYSTIMIEYNNFLYNKALQEVIATLNIKKNNKKQEIKVVDFDQFKI